MSALFIRKKRRLFRNMPTSLRARERFDDHLMNWMWLYALILIAALYGGEWLYHSTRDAVPLRMSTTMEARK